MFFFISQSKLDWVGPVDNRPCTEDFDQLDDQLN